MKKTDKAIASQVPTATVPNTPAPNQNPFAQKNPNSYGVTVSDPGNDMKDILYPPVDEKLLPVVIGDSGTMRYGGFFREDYDPTWADNLNRVTIVEQMRRGDATVAQLLKALKAPILAAKFDVKCNSEDPQDKEIEEFVKKNIFSMERSWKKFLREALTYLDFGFSVFEIIWEMREGKFWVKDLAPRIQHSILRWKLSDGSRGVVQLLRTDEAKNYYVEIPINKCVVFTNDMEGDDITGMPVLRAPYKHYFIKQQLYQFSAIGAERWAVGVPMITLPEGSGDADMARAKNIAASIRTNQESYVILPSDKWKMSVLTPAGRSTAGEDIKDQIEHHDRMILQAGLCGFLNLGGTDTGSFALSKDQHGFFLTHVYDRVCYFAEEFTNQVIKRLVDLNFGKREYYPELTFSNLGEEDKSAMATWLKTLVDAGLIKVDTKLTEFVHNNFQLPVLTEDDIIEMETAEVESQIGEIEEPEPDMPEMSQESPGNSDDEETNKQEK